MGLVVIEFACLDICLACVDGAMVVVHCIQARTVVPCRQVVKVARSGVRAPPMCAVTPVLVMTRQIAAVELVTAVWVPVTDPVFVAAIPVPRTIFYIVLDA